MNERSEAMFVGAYWTAREESKAQAAGRIQRFLTAVATSDERVARWFLQGASKTEANRPLQPEIDAIESVLREVPPVGYSLGAWNGGDASFSISIGCANPRVGNRAVLAFAVNANVSNMPWKALLETAVSAFDPDHAVVTDQAILDRANAKRPWEAGLLTYQRGGAIT